MHKTIKFFDLGMIIISVIHCVEPRSTESVVRMES